VEEEEPTSAEKRAKAAQQRNKVVKFFRQIFFAGREDDEEDELKKKNKPLPHWLIYIGYFVVFVVSAASGFFVILYGFSFGKVKSDKWIVAMLVSLCQSIFLIQPAKVI